MIENRNELEVTRKRIEYFQDLLAKIRANAEPRDFDSMAGGYRMEIEKMQAEVMDYLMRPITTVPDKQHA
jgi:hypothetical protein